MLSTRQERALWALLSCSTKKEAAEKAGISDTTLRKYLSDPEFLKRYQAETGKAMDSATRQLQGNMEAAIKRLSKIIDNDDTSDMAQISAIRTTLEYALRFTEINQIIRELEEDNVL